MSDKLLENLDNFVKEVNTTNKSNEKLKILAKYPHLKKILKYIFDKNLNYGIKSNAYKKFLKKKPKHSPERIGDIFDLLDMLANRSITGDKAKETLKYFISLYPEYQDLILSILDRNIKIRMNVSQLNKVFPGLIKTFEVMLAHKYEEKSMKSGKYYISRKLDGVRCICIFKSDNDIRFFSREGKEFVDKNDNPTLTALYEPLRQVFKDKIKPFVLDGEICIVNNNKEDFTAVMKQIRKNVVNPRYYLFDLLTLEEFENKKGNILFSKRLEKLRYFSKKHNSIRILPQIDFNDKNFKVMKEAANAQGWEGLMIRKNVVYKAGRSKDLLKYKNFFDEEYIVKDITVGPFRIISDETGLETTIKTMTAVVIDYGTNDTKVGSGFSIEERKMYYKNPKLIIGKKITVKYFEKTPDSLRFPTFVCIRDYE